MTANLCEHATGDVAKYRQSTGIQFGDAEVSVGKAHTNCRLIDQRLEPGGMIAEFLFTFSSNTLAFAPQLRHTV